MSLNKVILIGNVGADPEVRYFDNQRSLANFTVATNERGYTLQDGTEIPERTEWHNIVVRHDRVPFVERWVKKGSLVYVEGKIRTRSYDDQNGIKRYRTEIYADRIEFFSLGSGRRDDGQETTQQPQTTTTQQQYPSNQEYYQQPPMTANPSDPPLDDPDDLPF